MSEKIWCEVAVNFPSVDSTLTYSYLNGERKIKVGDIVKVPLGRRTSDGVVIKLFTENKKDLENIVIKEITEIISEDLIINEKELLFFSSMAKYYHYSLGKLIFDFLPKRLKKPRKIKMNKGIGSPSAFVLNNDQRTAIKIIEDKIKEKCFSNSLLHGVTGSGKSLIYLEAIKKSVSLGMDVLYLIPEINLTPQFIDFFKYYLDCDILIYNSSVTASEKFTIWKELSSKQSPVLILGTRSSIFLTPNNLGLIVVDEEHDGSFKQDDRCNYSARDMAYIKAKIHNCSLILGSATPSVETYFKFRNTKDYIYLPHRHGVSKLPTLELIDIKSKYDEDIYPFAPETVREINQTLEQDKKVIIFINRLGYASYIKCNTCGKGFECRNCSLPLRFYKKRNILMCNFCNYQESLPEHCPDCGNIKLGQNGFGTERVYDVSSKIFPGKKITRFDRDQVKNFDQVIEVLKDFELGNIDILIGTQMLSKGHNFKNVGLVVILGLDGQLNFPDFRSMERVYQTLVQVSGRAGRFGEESKVLVQTYNPECKVFQYIKNDDSRDFYNDEKSMREICNCPPFCKLAAIYLTGKDQKMVEKSSQVLANNITKLTKDHFKKVKLLGPKPAMVEKRVNQFTWTLLLKSNDLNELHNLLNTIYGNEKTQGAVTLKVDVDPLNIQ